MHAARARMRACGALLRPGPGRMDARLAGMRAMVHDRTHGNSLALRLPSHMHSGMQAVRHSTSSLEAPLWPVTNASLAVRCSSCIVQVSGDPSAGSMRSPNTVLRVQHLGRLLSHRFCWWSPLHCKMQPVGFSVSDVMSCKLRGTVTANTSAHAV